MVSHIVMWKFKDEIKADAFDLKMQFLHDKFVAMQGVIPGLLSISFSRTYKEGNFDAVLCCMFDSKESEEAYQTNPIHIEVKQVIGAWAKERANADFVC